MNSFILRTVSRLLVGLLLMFSVFLLLRGHNEPGGGFIGGLVAAAAFVLFGLADNERSARQALNFDTRTVIAAGLLLAGLSALLPVLLGRPFLSGLWAELQLFGSEVELGTPIFFDLGVYLAVIGVALTIILAMAEE
jgi:multicomponent Na+:H+ antiporter subunit B